METQVGSPGREAELGPSGGWRLALDMILFPAVRTLIQAAGGGNEVKGH